MLAISKQELWAIRHSIETGDHGDQAEALEIIEAILDKNVQVSVTTEQMYKDPLADDTEETAQELEAVNAA